MPSPPSSSTERPIKRRRGRAKEDPDYIPRPLNAFLIFRQEFCQTYAQNDATGKRVAQSIISKEAGISWKSMPYEMKKSWFLRANVAKQEHASKYPGYRFQPNFKKKKDVSTGVKKTTDAGKGPQNALEHHASISVSAVPAAMQVVLNRSSSYVNVVPSTLAPSPQVKTTTATRQGNVRERSTFLLLHEDLSATSGSFEDTSAVPAIAQSTQSAQPMSTLSLFPFDRASPPQLHRPLHDTQSTSSFKYDAYTHSSYPAMPALQQPYLDNAEAARGLSSTQAATSTDFDLFSAFWSPPFEALGMPSSTTPTRGVIYDPSVFDPQSFTVSQETVQIPASAQQVRWDSEAPYDETPEPLRDAYQNEWIASESLS